MAVPPRLLMAGGYGDVVRLLARELLANSTVPALSGALARLLLAASPVATRARVTLFIGNRNAKGAGAIASALASGFGAPAMVDLPQGRVAAYRFASPDEELLPRELQARGVLSPATWLAPEQWRARLVARGVHCSSSSKISI